MSPHVQLKKQPRWLILLIPMITGLFMMAGLLLEFADGGSEHGRIRNLCGRVPSARPDGDARQCRA